MSVYVGHSEQIIFTLFLMYHIYAYEDDYFYLLGIIHSKGGEIFHSFMYLLVHTPYALAIRLGLAEANIPQLHLGHPYTC